MIINLTPHALNIVIGEGDDAIQVAPSGTIARVSSDRKMVDSLEVEGGNIPIFDVQLGELEGLPPAEPGVTYVASLLAAKAAASLGRTDVLCPGELVRGEGGVVKGCNGLSRP